MFFYKPPIFYKRTSYGIKMVLTGRVCKHDLVEHIDCARAIADEIGGPFNLLLDMRKVIPICHDSARMLANGKMYFAGKGLNRMVIIYKDITQIDELVRTLKEYDNSRDRYLSLYAYKNRKIEKIAVEYLVNGKEP